MSVIYFIIFGALVGWLSSIILKTNSRQGLLGDIIVGILGSILGGWVMNVFGQPGVTGFNLYSILVGILGAVILIVIYRAIRKPAEA